MKDDTIYKMAFVQLSLQGHPPAECKRIAALVEKEYESVHPEEMTRVAWDWLDIKKYPPPEDKEILFLEGYINPSGLRRVRLGSIMSKKTVEENNGRGIAGGIYPGGGQVIGYSHWIEIDRVAK